MVNVGKYTIHSARIWDLYSTHLGNLSSNLQVAPEILILGNHHCLPAQFLSDLAEFGVFIFLLGHFWPKRYIYIYVAISYIYIYKYMEKCSSSDSCCLMILCYSCYEVVPHVF